MKRLDWASGVPAGEDQEPRMAEEEIYVEDGDEVGREDEGETRKLSWLDDPT